MLRAVDILESDIKGQTFFSSSLHFDLAAAVLKVKND